MDLRKPWFRFGRFLGWVVFAAMTGGIGLLVEEQHAYAAHGVYLDARVVASEDRHNEGGEDSAPYDDHVLTYEFRDAQGRAFQNWTSRSGRATPGERGAALRVEYDPGNPESSREGKEGDGRPWAEFALAALFGLVGVGLSWLFFVALLAEELPCAQQVLGSDFREARRSEWRPLADDPRGTLGWWWRGFRSGGWPPFLAFGALTLLGLAAWTPLAFATAGAYAVLVAAAYARKGDAQRLTPLLPDPAPERQLKARVAYERAAMAMARDAVALVLVDGWLVGEGLRSGFALRADDVHRVVPTADGTCTCPLADGGCVRLSGVPPEAFTTLRDWHRSERGVSGDSTFPPARAHPQTLAKQDAWTAFGLTLSFLPLALGTLVDFPDGLRWTLVGTGLAVALLSVRVRWVLGRLGDQAARATRAEPPLGAPGAPARPARRHSAI